jgi:hypothetical protein
MEWIVLDGRSDQRDPIAEPSAQDLDEWEFGSSETASTPATNAPATSAPDGDTRTEAATEATLAEWEFGRASDRTARPPGSFGSRTPSTLEERLAPFVGLLVVVSLLLSSAYLLVVTIW